MITWANDGGPITSNSSRMTLEAPRNIDVISSYVLLFDPLSVEDEGNYTCQADTRDEEFSYTYLVVVTTSKFICEREKMFLISNFNLQGN